VKHRPRPENLAPLTAQSFPVLSLEQVYGAIAFYLANRDSIDRYLDDAKTRFEATRQAARDADPMFYQKLAQAKRNPQDLHP
jgi:hypothetical protein